MPKSLILTLFLFLSISCNTTGEGTTDINPEISDGVSLEDGSTEEPEPNFDNVVVPTMAQTFGANIYYVNFNADQADKYDKAVEIVKAVVATEEFKRRVLNHSYNGSKTYVDNNGKSNAQIYKMILEGAEVLQKTKNNAIDVEVELYHASTTTVGYTYPSSKRIWMNTKYFNAYTPAEVAGNLFHEWLHKLGFTHAASYSPRRDYTVPYAIGRMISSLGKKYK